MVRSYVYKSFEQPWAQFRGAEDWEAFNKVLNWWFEWHQADKSPCLLHQ